MNQFKIEDSFAVEPDKFVFAGTMVEGKVGRGMTFEVPEAGDKWKCTVRSVEFVRKSDGTEILGLVVEKRKQAYLPGTGVGWTCELHEQ